jgi:hypothetical protein
MGIEATAGFSAAENAMAAYHHLCWWIFCFGFARHMVTFIPILLADARSVDTLVWITGIFKCIYAVLVLLG